MWFVANNIDSHSIEWELIMFINIKLLRLRSTDWESSVRVGTAIVFRYFETCSMRLPTTTIFYIFLTFYLLCISTLHYISLLTVMKTVMKQLYYNYGVVPLTETL